MLQDICKCSSGRYERDKKKTTNITYMKLHRTISDIFTCTLAYTTPEPVRSNYVDYTECICIRRGPNWWCSNNSIYSNSSNYSYVQPYHSYKRCKQNVTIIFRIFLLFKPLKILYGPQKIKLISFDFDIFVRHKM